MAALAAQIIFAGVPKESRHATWRSATGFDAVIAKRLDEGKGNATFMIEFAVSLD